MLAGVLLLSLAAVAGAAVVAVGATRSAVHDFLSCSLRDESIRPLGRTSFVYAANGVPLGAIRHEYYREPVALEDVSPSLVTATLAIEDRRFYEHDGLDLRGIARAAVRNIEAREIVEGGSTLTQQLVRNLYLSRDQTWERKRKEACLALKLEEEWSKERILAAYLNRAFYGHRAIGVEAAARAYFGRPASKLGPAQAALLAGLPQSPSLYDPIVRPQTARARRNEVLAAMRDIGAVPPEEYERLAAKPLGLAPGKRYTQRRDPEFFQFVERQLVEGYGEQLVRQGGLRVTTTLVPRYQRLARQAIRSNLSRRGDPASAIVSIDPRNGAIRALTQVVPGRRQEFNVAWQGRRQAGSAFKTFVLVEAMRQGMNPYATRYRSAPFSHVPGPGQDPWEPKTYDGGYYGPSTVVQATLRSDNVVYARLTLDVGPERIAERARAMGITTALQPVASIGLGANSVSVLEMASAYGTLAAGGVYREPYAIERVVLPSGEVDAATWRRSSRRAVPAPVAYHVTRILERNMNEGTGRAALIGRPAAGKTGTTDEHTDAWFAGYTPRLSTAVWVGYPKRTLRMLNVHGIRVAGGTFPAQIWGDYMGRALRASPVGWRRPAESWEWRPWRRAHTLVSQPEGRRPDAGDPSPRDRG
ncbi:MAG: transglycosylase domain-containing protein [Thermoleophilia bacterium]|nr:transglycosylase domain-containing protein [Thermoleophilia bacterium]